MKRIAVAYEDGNVFQHFGHTRQFKVYTVKDDVVESSAVIEAGDSGHGALGGFLRDNGVDALICGGIGAGAQQALAASGIALFGGVSGNADQAVAAFLAGQLDHNPNPQCGGHGSGHSHFCQGHDHGHTCGGRL